MTKQMQNMPKKKMVKAYSYGGKVKKMKPPELKEELKAGLAALGEDVTDEELQVMMGLADPPEGEQINYDKFVFTFK